MEERGEAEFAGFLPGERGFLEFEVFEGAEGHLCTGVLYWQGCWFGQDGIDGFGDDLGTAWCAPCKIPNKINPSAIPLRVFSLKHIGLSSFRNVAISFHSNKLSRSEERRCRERV